MNDRYPPVFLVGMPRSGTKLVRDLINNSPEISIPVAESLFIPQIMNHHDLEAGAASLTLRKIYSDFTKTTFFLNMANEGIRLSWEEFARRNCSELSWQSIFQSIFQYYCFTTKPSAVRWGDKSPLYRLHLPTLKTIFKDARFIHIIRDPRDHALSVKHAWGKSMLRAADLWRVQVKNTHEQGRKLGESYMEVRYEDLLMSPKDTLRKVYAFLEIEFKDEYLHLSRPSEDLGDTVQKNEIVATNMNKYLRKMKPALINRINALTVPTAVEFGYLQPGVANYRPLSPFRKITLYLFDGFASISFHMRRKGLLKGIRYFGQLRKTRSA
jgi:hypothetical protein